MLESFSISGLWREETVSSAGWRTAHLLPRRQTCIFLLTPRIPLDWTRDSRNWISCRDRDRRERGAGVWARLSPGPGPGGRGPAADYLSDHFLLLSVFLSQARHLPPQSFILPETEAARLTHQQRELAADGASGSGPTVSWSLSECQCSPVSPSWPGCRSGAC